jgi:hypothetical protein
VRAPHRRSLPPAAVGRDDQRDLGSLRDGLRAMSVMRRK